MAQWYCVSLESLFPHGFVGSIPTLGVRKKNYMSRRKSVLYFLDSLFEILFITLQNKHARTELTNPPLFLNQDNHSLQNKFLARLGPQ